jgi:hypothetical protein
MTPENAQTLTIQILQFLAGDPDQLSRFLGLTGLEVEDLRRAATQKSFHIGLIDYLMGDEPTLLAFAASINCDPADIAAARTALSRHDE